jgi:hypothetical protein
VLVIAKKWGKYYGGVEDQTTKRTTIGLLGSTGYHMEVKDVIRDLKSMIGRKLRAEDYRTYWEELNAAASSRVKVV